MTSQTIEITTPDGVTEAYVSRPDDGDHPGVLLFMDAMGVRPRIQEMADRIAGWGHVVLVPNVFYRHGTIADLAPSFDPADPEAKSEFLVGVFARLKSYTADQVASDTTTFVDTLHGLPGVAGTDIGTTGYCMGGVLSLRSTATRPDAVAGAGVFHAGGLVTDAPDSPHLSIAGARAEVLARHADNDQSNGPEQIAVLEQALAAEGLTFTSEIYPGAVHGFTMSDAPVYDEAAAERHFDELEALFARTLTQP